MKSLSKLLTPSLAYYDPETDEIVNCEPGSWAYLHEEGHRRQLNTIKKWAIMEQNAVVGAIVASAFGYFAIAQVLVTLFGLYWLYLEVDASVYAIRKRKKLD